MSGQEIIPVSGRLTDTLAEHFGFPEGKIAAALCLLEPAYNINSLILRGERICKGISEP